MNGTGIQYLPFNIFNQKSSPYRSTLKIVDLALETNRLLWTLKRLRQDTFPQPGYDYFRFRF